jgi:MFS superfamily sulfate permease-like transporter
VLGGFPVSSSGSRTAVADATGARSQRASLVAAGVVAVVLVAGGTVLESFPVAALGGLVVYAAGYLVDVPEIRRVIAFRRSEALLVLTTFAGVVVFGVLTGIAVAVVLSVGDLFARVARAHDAIQGTVPGMAGFHDVDDWPDATTEPGLVMYRYDAPLCFANAEDFRLRVLDAVAAEDTPVEWVLLNMEANVEIDLTAIDMLEDLRAELTRRGIVVALARVKQDLARYLDRVGLLGRIGDDHVFATLPTAVEGFRSRPKG